MSNYREFFKYKATGNLHQVDCLDNYFGNREYGYRPLVYGVDEVVLTEKEFKEEYEKVNQPGDE
jgi:hypothetical protein